MEVKVFWTDFAKKQLRQIFDYHHEKVSLKIAREIVAGIVNETKILNFNAEIEQAEELLAQRKQDFRYYTAHHLAVFRVEYVFLCFGGEAESRDA